MEAARRAISSPLLEGASVNGARGVIINVTGGPDLSLVEVSEASAIVQEAADEDANIIFGAVVDPALKGKVKITVIATGFGAAGGARGRRASAAQTPVDMTHVRRPRAACAASRCRAAAAAPARLSIAPAPAARPADRGAAAAARPCAGRAPRGRPIGAVAGEPTATATRSAGDRDVEPGLRPQLDVRRAGVPAAAGGLSRIGSGVRRPATQAGPGVRAVACRW